MLILVVWDGESFGSLFFFFKQKTAYEMRISDWSSDVCSFDLAFSLPSANMSFERRADFTVGNGIFRKIWVPAPSSTTSSDGLGPLFNARGCQSCHLKDGRGQPPPPGRAGTSLTMVPSVAVPLGAAPSGMDNVRGDPVYGAQIQTSAVQGLKPEAQLRLDYETVPIRLADGTVIDLRKPHWRLTQLAYGPLAEGAAVSPRVAPQMIGLGLLEAIDPEDILAAAEPADRDGDGVSGRPNRADRKSTRLNSSH